MATLARSPSVSMTHPIIGSKVVAEKIPRLTGYLQVPPEIEDAVRNVLGDDGKCHLKGAKCIVSCIQSLESGRVEDVLDYLITTKADERFARFFIDGPTEVQLQAGIVFGFLACGNAHHANSAIRQSIFSTCIRLLSSPLPDLCVQSAWILGNLACEVPAYATTFISAGVPEKLIEAVKGYIEADRSSTNTPQTATIIWTINSLERGAPYLLDEHLRYELISFFAKLFKEEDELLDDIIREICLFFHSCCLEPRWLEALVNADVAPSLIDIIIVASPALQTAALQVIGAISASEYDNVLIEAGVFPVLRSILVAESTLRLAEDACWIMANLTDCTDHVDALMRDVEAPRLLCDIIAEVTNAYEQVIYEVRTREALRVIANVVGHGTFAHIRQLVSKSQCIHPIVDLLKKWNESETLLLAIGTLWKLIRQGELCKVLRDDGEVKNAYWALFEMAGGDEGLRGLMEHTDSTVANTAANTLTMLAEMTESVAAAQEPASRTASLHPSGPFQDYPDLAMQSDHLDGSPRYDRLSRVRQIRRDENDALSSSGSTAEVRRQLQADDADEDVTGVVGGVAAENESVVLRDDESYAQGPPSTVPESEASQLEGSGSTPWSRSRTPNR